MNRNETSLRIWSAGCARGEPYSMAILIRELRNKEGWPEHVHFLPLTLTPRPWPRRTRLSIRRKA